MHIKEFDYYLPKELIAQNPSYKRDKSRLMVINRKTGNISHHCFYELPEILDKNCLLVFNNSKVIPARLFGKINDSNIEILLIKNIEKSIWHILAKPGKKFVLNSEINFIPQKNTNIKLKAKVKTINHDGSRIIEFNHTNLEEILPNYGILPLPPYIRNYQGNIDRYQTIYAKNSGSVAAPTAGLHFTDKIFDQLNKKGIEKAEITLHIGLGTFMEVRTEEIEDHKMHSENFFISKKELEKINKAKKEGKKIISIGTTATRVLEASSDENHLIKEGNPKNTNIFIYPGYKFKFIDGLITNFHLPKSTLLMLVSAFAGKELIRKAYETAIKKKYRFYSFGDAMLII